MCSFFFFLVGLLRVSIFSALASSVLHYISSKETKEELHVPLKSSLNSRCVVCNTCTPYNSTKVEEIENYRRIKIAFCELEMQSKGIKKASSSTSNQKSDRVNIARLLLCHCRFHYIVFLRLVYFLFMGVFVVITNPQCNWYARILYEQSSAFANTHVRRT